MIEEVCRDEFVVRLHEFSFWCYLPKGHPGSHAAERTEHKQDRALEEDCSGRVVIYQASWDQ